MIIEMHFKGPAENCERFANTAISGASRIYWPHDTMAVVFEFDHDDECRAVEAAMDCVDIDACDEFGVELWGM